MTEISVDEYDDLRGDEILHSKGRDVVLKEIESGTEAVLWMEDWLVDEKELDPLGPVSDLAQLFAGRKVAETDRAFLITQTDDRDPDADAPGTEWVPKSSTRLYVRGDVDEDDENDREYPAQRGLTDF